MLTFGRLIGYLLLTPLVIFLEVHARPVEVILRHSLVRLRDVKLQLPLSTAEDVSGGFPRTFEATTYNALALDVASVLLDLVHFLVLLTHITSDVVDYIEVVSMLVWRRVETVLRPRANLLRVCPLLEVALHVLGFTAHIVHLAANFHNFLIELLFSHTLAVGVGPLWIVLEAGAAVVWVGHRKLVHLRSRPCVDRRERLESRMVLLG